MRNLEANYVIRNEGADYIIDKISKEVFDNKIHKEENKSIRYAIEYCYKNFDTDQTTYGLDYEYFDSEKEANEFIEEFNNDSNEKEIIGLN